MSGTTWNNALKFPHVASLVLVAFVAAALYLTRDKDRIVQLENTTALKKQIGRDENNCDLFSGRWVYDDVSHPLYNEKKCEFMEEDFACESMGKKNLKYQHWRWQPHQCDLPRFNGTALLEKLRNKKLIYVGDSLIRNQWRSMLCMMEPYLPPSSNKLLKTKGNMTYLHSADYNATIGFYWEPLLVESNCDDVVIHRTRPRIIRIKSIANSARHWNDADILVFDSYAWWMDPTMTIIWGSFDSPHAIYKEVEMNLRRYEITLNTWSDWLEININRTKTKVFFMSASPFSLGTTSWGTDYNCHNQTEPVFDQSYWPSGANRSMMEIVESTIEKLEQRGVKVEYLNITQLSGYREDAHPSIYRTFWKTTDKEQFKDPIRFSDCMHWCLPGVPDTWNEILFAYLIK